MEINSLNVGIEVGESKVSIPAFTDNPVLLTQNRGDVQVLFYKATRLFHDHGLKVNVQKCQYLLSEAVSGKHNHKVSTDHHRWWKGEPLPGLIFDTLAKYLGVEFNQRGEIILPDEKWLSMFNNIWGAPLWPHQRAEIIKIWLTSYVSQTYQCQR